MFINEPFNSGVRDVEQVAQNIVHLINTPTDSPDFEPLTVITKSMASYIPSDGFQAMQELASANLWTIRDPLTQMGSLLTRLANDLFAGHNGGQIDQRMIAPYYDDLAAYLQSGPHLQNFEKTGWGPIIAHFGERNLDRKQIVVDATVLCANPAKVLQTICKRVGLPYSENMLGGWANGYVNMSNGNNVAETESSGWSRHAATSSGFENIAPREQLDLDQVPAAIRRHIEEIALPAFAELSASA